MLKLKYLFHNEDLAHMILRNWDYDYDDPNLLKQYRISSNAVYCCKNQFNTFFLRFTPSEEKSKKKILAELEFLNYLRDNDYPAVDTILSKNGNELEVVDTPWGTFYAVAFKQASGKHLSEMSFTNELIFGLGKSLGKLHKLSNAFTPVNNKRSDWKETACWIKDVLSKFPDETAAKNELSILTDYFSKLLTTKENFGLIHYDFETDNIFYNKTTKTYIPIDFDDSMYHWYALDIGKSLDSIKQHIPKEQVESSINEFIKGYRSEYAISNEMLKLLPLFKRYDNLYSYVRILRSLDEKWNNEPAWMIDLRIKLDDFLNKEKDAFTMQV